jgi:2',3'-cyclic-nucleotide 2'-phosphodiesterase (5'-nucleotidase family)
MPHKGLPLVLIITFGLVGFISSQDQYAYIAFVNDVHNRIEEEDPTTSTPCSPTARSAGTCVGGWPRISTAVKSLRLQAAKENPPAAFFFLDAGDEFTGTMWDAVYQGQTVTPSLLNKVKPDVMVSLHARYCICIIS